MGNKKTKRDFFGELRAIVAGNAELEAFIDHEVALLDKKTSAKSSKVNEAQTEYMANIKEALSRMDKPVTITQLQKADEGMAELSNQRISAMLNKMVKTGEVEKIIDKKTSYFKVA